MDNAFSPPSVLTETQRVKAKTGKLEREQRMEKECYVRYRGRGWVPATAYHRHALSLYMELQADKQSRRGEPVLICTTRYDGSLFMANFRKKNPAIYLFQEVDMNGDGEEVEIMFCAVPLSSSVT